MTEHKFQKKLAKAKARKHHLEQKQQIKELRRYGKHKIETSKILAIYLIALFTGIILYSLIAMWHFQDLSHLSTLITAFVSEVMTFLIYCAKAFFAKKNKELIALQREQMSAAEGEPDNENSVSFAESPHDDF